MKARCLLLTIFLSFLTIALYPQEYSFRLEPLEIEDMGGIQSFAYATHDNYIIIFGGRLDGLHMKQPWASFHPDGNNTDIILLNLNSLEVTRRSLSDLGGMLEEQLSSTNMQFHQEGELLIITGGYGFSQSNNDHITHPYVSFVDIPVLVNAIENNKEIRPAFQQIKDNYFAVTGGQLKSIGDTLYLVGGQKFTGRYNPHGPDHGPGFVQEYITEVRRFVINTNANNYNYLKLDSWHDENHLHRRDYNLVPQINYGNEAIMVFSGVFQKEEDLPWLYPVYIADYGITPIENFTQYFNHYHCAVAPIYNSSSQEMHNIFFGGIAQFYIEDNNLVQDNDVPFVNTIADVVRHQNGNLEEFKLAQEMPGYLGASSEFIIAPGITHFQNGVIEGDQIKNDELLVGYILGGIRSTAKNIFWVNDGTQSAASNTLFKIYASKNTLSSNSEAVALPHTVIIIYPNPNNGDFNIQIDVKETSNMNLKMINVETQSAEASIGKDYILNPGKNIISYNYSDSIPDGIYLLDFDINGKHHIKKVVISN